MQTDAGEWPRVNRIPFSGQPVDVRRLDLRRAVAAEIAVAEVVGEDDDDVRPPCRGRGKAGGQKGEQEQKRGVAFHCSPVLVTADQDRSDFVAVLDDGHGRNDVLNLIIEVTGEKKKDTAAEVATARNLWVPAMNNRGYLRPLAVYRDRRPLGRPAPDSRTDQKVGK